MKNYCRSFISDQRGVSAVEFAFVAAPFLALLFGIIQLALIFFANNLLDMGVRHAARLVLTGQAQEASWAPPEPDQTSMEAKIAKFRSEVCRYAGALLTCNDLKFDLRVLSSFSDAVPGVSIKDGQIDNSGLGFAMGGRNDIVMVRVMYLLPTYSDIFGAALINAGTNKRLIISTAVFVNEPF